MPDNNEIQIRENAPIFDTIGSLARQVGLIISGVPLLLALLGSGNFAGLVEFFRSNDGAAFIGAVSAVVIGAYGLYQRFRRASQLKSAAQNPLNNDISIKS